MQNKTILKYTLSSAVVSLSVPFIVASPINAETGYTTDYTDKQAISDTNTLNNNDNNQVDKAINDNSSQPYSEGTALAQPDNSKTGSSEVPNIRTAPISSSDIDENQLPVSTEYTTDNDAVEQSTQNTGMNDSESTLQDDTTLQDGKSTEGENTTDTSGNVSNEEPSSQLDNNTQTEPSQTGDSTGSEYPGDATGDGTGQTELPQTGDTMGEQPSTQPDDNVEPQPPQDGGTTGTEYPNDAPGNGGGQTEPPQTGGSGQSNPTHNDGVNGGNTTYPTGGPSSQTSGNASNVNDNRVATSDDSNYGDLSQSSNKVKQNSNSINNSTDVNSNSGRDSNPSNYQNDSLSYNYEQNKNATSSGAKPASAQTFGDLANQQKDSNEDSDSNVMNRFRQLAPGSFKYNPYVLKQVKALNNDDSNVSDSDINAIFSKQKFTDNSYLRELQKSTNYFKFQYFNPIKFDDYYKNLDNQVLSLITGEIGSMPDLKAPKTKKTQGAYEYEESDDTETTQTRQEAEKADKGLKFERVLFTLIAGIIVIFIGVVTTYFIHRRKK